MDQRAGTLRGPTTVYGVVHQRRLLPFVHQRGLLPFVQSGQFSPYWPKHSRQSGRAVRASWSTDVVPTMAYTVEFILGLTVN